MAKNLLVINVDIRETRVALIENGIIAELHIERDSQKGTLGNIYLGKVSRVLPGMQAAFIDVGLERAAFLHVEDLIRPDDFEAYLAGNKGRAGAPNAVSDEDRAAMPSAEDAAEQEAAAIERERQEREDQAREAGRAHEEPEGDAAPAADLEDRLDRERDQEIEDDSESIELPTALDVEEPAAVYAGEGAEEDVPSDDDDGEEEPEAVEMPSMGPPTDTKAHGWVSDALGDVSQTHPRDIETLGDVSEAEAWDSETLASVSETQPTEGEALAAGSSAEASATEPHDEAAAAVPVDAAMRGGRGRRRSRKSGRTADRRPIAAEAQAAPARADAPEEARRAEPREASRSNDRGGDRDRDRSRGRGRGRSGQNDRRERGGRDQRSRDGRDSGRRQGGAHHEPPRVSKTTPIREVVREGQEVIVQISKEPIGTKGARVTSHVSLPGRYVVYLPTVDHVGISKRIGSERERQRLRETMEAMKPPQGGLIVRTLAEGLTKKQLKSDVGYLVRLWGEVAKKREETKRAPACLYTELDLVLKTARDLFTEDIEKIVIDSKEEHTRLVRFVEMFLPERANDIELYDGEEPIFDAYGIEDEIQRAQSRKVPLASGGHLIIDQAEALTAIDVNTGRFVGKGSKDLEDTILKTNLEAVEEIAYQLRFRNIGGLIILDLIDMERASNREKVRKKLEELLSKDKAKTTLNRISDLGLIEMTRKRTRESLGRTVLEPCFYCDGTGQLQSKQTIAYEILRQIRRERLNLAGYVVVVNAHPAVVDLLKSDERIAVQEAEKLFQRRIELVPRKEYHLEQFDLQGR